MNHTAASAQITEAMTGPDWRLTVVGARTAIAQPGAVAGDGAGDRDVDDRCTEGWSTTQHWTGVRLIDLARLVGAAPAAILHAISLQSDGLEQLR